MLSLLLLLWQFKTPECQVLVTNTQFDLNTAVARRTFFVVRLLRHVPPRLPLASCGHDLFCK